MARIFVNDNGQVRDFEDVKFAEGIVEKRAKKDPWDVIDDLVKMWAKKTPDDVESMVINVTQYRESLKDKEFGQTAGGGDHERRFKLAFPRNLMWMIRSQYKTEELQFDREFFDKFADRYPAFRVAEKG